MCKHDFRGAIMNGPKHNNIFIFVAFAHWLVEITTASRAYKNANGMKVMRFEKKGKV